jgi:enamine deaminase RidA (YjgF/YER057c/UK114 family)
MAGFDAKKIRLPIPPDPLGVYDAGVIRNGIGFVSGQFPLKDGRLLFRGRVGADLSEGDGKKACEYAALNVLAQISRLTNGFETLDGLLVMDGYVASGEGFFAQSKILDPASELFVAFLGERGHHARTAFAVPQLPLDAPVELAVTFAVKAIG